MKPFRRPTGRCEVNIKLNFKQMGYGWCVLDSRGSGYGSIAGCCDHDNENPGSIKYWKFLEKLSDYQLLKDSTSDNLILCRIGKSDDY